MHRKYKLLSLLCMTLFVSLSLYIQHNLVQTDTNYSSYHLRVILKEQKLKARRAHKNLLHLLEQNILNTQVRIVANVIRDFMANLKIFRVDGPGFGL